MLLFEISCVDSREGEAVKLARCSDVWLNHAGRGSDKWAHYLPFLDSELGIALLEGCRILEIGVQNGGNLEVL